MHIIFTILKYPFENWVEFDVSFRALTESGFESWFGETLIGSLRIFIRVFRARYRIPKCIDALVNMIDRAKSQSKSLDYDQQ